MQRGFSVYTRAMKKACKLSTPALIEAITMHDIVRDRVPALEELTAEFSRRYYKGDAVALEYMDGE